MSIIGAWLNRRYAYHDIPMVVNATLPIAIGLALLSGNIGRMLFAAFPAVIAYALIAIEHVTDRVPGTSLCETVLTCAKASSASRARRVRSSVP